MAYKDFDSLSFDGATQNSQTVLNGDTDRVELPDASYVRDADFTRDGMDLVMNGPEGELVIKDYFADESQPNLVAPDGSTLTPELVNSFTKSSAQYAANDTQSDESPVGAVQEVTGVATVTHVDGSVETIVNGTEIYKGDIIETDEHGAVNIKFVDETSFAVSEDARLAIDEYVYDAGSQSGETNFSVLKGVFVFTSGLIGRDDPDDVHIETPVGSIGIRGTIIAGNVDKGEITVVEGAIVLKDHSGHEVTLATQFETARFGGSEGIEHMGQLSAKDVAQKFFVVSKVSPTLFSSINDAASEQPSDDATQPVAEPVTEEAPAEETAPTDPAPVQTEGSNTATDAAATQTAALPPVPPPVTMQTTSSFAPSTTNVLGNNVMTTTTHDTTTTNTMNTVTTQMMVNTTAAAGTTTNVLPPPPPPNNPPPVNSGATNNAPHFVGEAPAEFFKSSEGMVWRYNFDKEFRDDGGHAGMTYELSAATVAALNAWNGNIINGGSSWTFNAANGELLINFSAASPTTPGTSSTLTIEVQAVDSQGAASGYQDYDLVAYNATLTNLPTTHNASGSVISEPGSIGTSQIAGSNNIVFLGVDPDQITINSGSGNMVNLGGGNNTFTVMTPATGNVAVGGDNNDKFVLNNAATKAYGMDGDDSFHLVLNSTTVVADLTTAGSNTMLDGGHSNFRAAVGLGLNHLQGEVGGRGDSLVLEGTGTLDFGAIPAGNQITSIERIDMVASTSAQTVTLNYNDILRITDDKNALIINVGTGDTLNLNGMTGMSKVENDISINDAANGDAASNRNYDVFTDGNVTLFVSNTGGTVNLDGNTVTI